MKFLRLDDNNASFILQVYPIWLCPCKFFKNPGLAHLPSDIEEMYIDVGIYGVSPKTENYDAEMKIRKLEKFVTENKGYERQAT